MHDRFVVLGLAPTRSEWFHAVGRWTTSALLPAEFIRCVSLQDLHARLSSGRRFSAVLIDGVVHGLDRDVLTNCVAAGAAVVVVDAADAPRDWLTLGAAAVVGPLFSPDELLEVLRAVASPVGSGVMDPAPSASPSPTASGSLVAVTGPGGTGASTLAAALAQELSAGERGRGSPGLRVVLADLCRRADQAMLHDAKVLVPSVQELVEAHRTGSPDPTAVREQTFTVPARGYRLLLGLRRSTQWATLRRHAYENALTSLLRIADRVVADVEADVEGEAESGSTEVEERNLLARLVVLRADVVVVVLEPSMKGIFAGVRTIDELTRVGVAIDRVLPVVNRAPRGPRARAELRAAMVRLSTGMVGATPSPQTAIFLPTRDTDTAFRDGVALPTSLGRPLSRAVEAVRERAGSSPVRRGLVDEPVRVVPGSLGLAGTDEVAS